jgi:hypothetical protein
MYFTSPLPRKSLIQHLLISKLFEHHKGRKHFGKRLKDNIEDAGCEDVNWMNLGEDSSQKGFLKHGNKPSGFTN